MGEAILTLLIVILLLIGACFIGCLVLLKDTKDFHMQVGLFRGFEISGSFFEKQQTQENHK